MSPQTPSTPPQPLYEGSSGQQGVRNSDDFKVSSFSQLTTQQKEIADVWVKALYKNNRGLAMINTKAGFDAAREHVWDLVFRGWDTSTAIKKPAKPVPQPNPRVTVQIGTLALDAPPPAEAGKSGEAVPTIPDHRRAGAPVYHTVVFKPKFHICDAQNAEFPNDISIDHLPRTIYTKSLGKATRKYDQAELDRMGRANTAWAVFCLQTRLLHSMKEDGNPHNHPIDGQQASTINDDVDIGKLQYIHLFADWFESFAEVANASEGSI